MTSKEIVKRCIEFKNPPRIGLHFDVEPLNGKKWPITDFGWVSYPFDPLTGFNNANNDFGMKNTSIAKSEQDKGQIKEHPLENWSDLGKLKWPDYTKKERYFKLEKEIGIFRAEGRYIYAAVPAIMQLSSDLRGIEDWFVDHLINQDELGILLEKITRSRIEMLNNYHKLGVDGVITWDDMGTNNDTLIGPDEFRQIYFPWYKKFVDEVHNRKMHFIHHCCGKVNKLMDMFLEAGTDVMQLDQPGLMGIDFLSEYYGGKICFWSCVDIQTTMQTGSLEDIQKEAHQLVGKLGSFDGGFMVKAYESPEAIDMTEEKFIAQYEAFLEKAEYTGI